LTPLIILGVFSIFIGFINTPFFHGFEKVLHKTLYFVDITHLPEGISLIILALVSIFAGFAGLVLAYLIYIVNIFSYFKFKIPFKEELKLLSSNSLYINKLGELIFIRALKLVSKKIAVVVDGLMIDGLVNKIVSIFYNSSKIISKSQTGFVRSYVVYFGFFMLLLIGLFIATPWVLS